MRDCVLSSGCCRERLTMWFLGLIVGLVIGAAVAGFGGAFCGAAFGALAGHALRLTLGRETEARLRALEREVKALREGLAAAPTNAAQAPAVASATDTTAHDAPARPA